MKSTHDLAKELRLPCDLRWSAAPTKPARACESAEHATKSVLELSAASATCLAKPLRLPRYLRVWAAKSVLDIVKAPRLPRKLLLRKARASVPSSSLLRTPSERADSRDQANFRPSRGREARKALHSSNICIPASHTRTLLERVLFRLLLSDRQLASS